MTGKNILDFGGTAGLAGVNDIRECGGIGNNLKSRLFFRGGQFSNGLGLSDEGLRMTKG